MAFVRDEIKIYEVPAIFTPVGHTDGLCLSTKLTISDILGACNPTATLEIVGVDVIEMKSSGNFADNDSRLFLSFTDFTDAGINNTFLTGNTLSLAGAKATNLMIPLAAAHQEVDAVSNIQQNIFPRYAYCMKNDGTATQTNIYCQLVAAGGTAYDGTARLYFRIKFRVH